MYPSEDHSSNYNATGHNQPGTTQMEYAPEDFSQAAINSGQRKINYALTLVIDRLTKALETVRDAVAALPAAHKIDLTEVNEAINEVYELNQQVAGIKPPGCDPDWPA